MLQDLVCTRSIFPTTIVLLLDYNLFLSQTSVIRETPFFLQMEGFQTINFLSEDKTRGSHWILEKVHIQSKHSDI